MNFKQFVSFTLLMAMLLTGCTEKNMNNLYTEVLVQQPPIPKKQDVKVESAYHEGFISFCYETTSLLFLNSEENENFSPLSLYFALAMLMNGTISQEQAVLLNMLGVDSLTALNQNTAALLGELVKSEEAGELFVANSLWLQEDYGFNQEYLDTVAKYYFAWLFEVDFPSGKGDEYGNAWISEQVRETMEPNLKAQEDTILRIINTLYFRSRWMSFGREKLPKKILFCKVEKWSLYK